MSNKREIRTVLLAEIYEARVPLLVTSDKKAGTRFFKKGDFVGSDGGLANINDGVRGRTVYSVDGPELRIWLETKDLSILAHELCHVTIAILWSRGVKIEPGNDEPFAYLFQSLFRQAVKAFNA